MLFRRVGSGATSAAKDIRTAAGVGDYFPLALMIHDRFL